MCTKEVFLIKKGLREKGAADRRRFAVIARIRPTAVRLSQSHNESLLSHIITVINTMSLSVNSESKLTCQTIAVKH